MQFLATNFISEKKLHDKKFNFRFIIYLFEIKHFDKSVYSELNKSESRTRMYEETAFHET